MKPPTPEMSPTPTMNLLTPTTIITLTLPYAGHKGETVINKMRKHINKTIPNTKKLGSKFKIKDQTKKEHQHNVVYHAKCPDPQCNSNYIGQIQHNKQDKNSNLLIHSNGKSHHRVWLDDFEIIGKGFGKSNFKRQISEALYIKEKAPNLNIQKNVYRTPV